MPVAGVTTIVLGLVAALAVAGCVAAIAAAALEDQHHPGHGRRHARPAPAGTRRPGTGHGQDDQCLPGRVAAAATAPVPAGR